MQRDQNSPADSSSAIRHSRLKLVAIISMFLGPLLAAFIWYYGFEAKFAPTGQGNHAPLISPVVTIGNFKNPLHGGGSVNQDTLKRKWTVVHLIGDSCAEPCETFLYHTRQTRLALGKDASRVQRFLIVADPIMADRFASEHSDAFLLQGSQSLENKLKENFQQSRGYNDAILIDPLGNAMMRIPPDMNPRLLLKDFKKLLKLSHIG
jgi:cytochrome oxidase Cu insertion factor (SCO1/SenC/PrrC family)